MAYRVLEITASSGQVDTLRAIAEKYGARLTQIQVEDEGLESCRIVAGPKDRQKLLDAIQATLGSDPEAQVVIFPVQAVVPQPDSNQEEHRSPAVETREELYNDMLKGSDTGPNFILLVVLSTVVAAIGLLQDNVAVVIGAMVIAPLLGPNLAFAFAVAVGDKDLMVRSIRTTVFGLSMTLAITMALGLIWPYGLESRELLDRTVVNYGSLALALASGTAAALSLTTGVSTALVGVMVAVALLPPAATFGIMAGAGEFYLAIGAATLLAANVVSVILTAQIVFIFRGIGPRTWWERKRARASIKLNLWVLTSFLALIAGLIYLQGQV
ncbi:MAG: TIGR00341 family protein [Alphaproteobacteria bacterium]|nr:MAG: TIGR00341 family protein [Alphaproteobacteria bacterium]